MEAGLNDSYLHNCNLESMSQFFFVQRWTELLNFRTISSYKPRLFNSKLILKELISVLDDVLGNVVGSSNIRPIVEEALTIVKEDVILKRRVPVLWERILRNLGDSMKVEDRAAQLRLQCQMKYAYGLIESEYLDWLIYGVEQAMLTNSASSLGQLDTIMSVLVTELLGCGWSSQELYKLSKRIFLSREDFGIKWNRFRAILLRVRQPFLCFVHIEKDIEYFKSMSVERIVEDNDAKLRLAHDIVKEFDPCMRNVSPNGMYLQMTVYTYDIYAAVRSARERLDRIIAILTFYNYPVDFLQESEIFVYDNTKKVIFPCGYEHGLIRYGYNQNPYDKHLNDFLTASNLDGFSREFGSKLYSVTQYIRLSRESVSIFGRFINLWIALEAFLKTDEFKSIAELVVASVPSICCNAYMYRLLRNFTEDIRRCKKDVEQDDVTVEYLFETLKNKKAVELVGNANTLLSYRCEEMMSILETGRSCARVLEEHHRRVGWQIRRLYRIRNKIAHSAYTDCMLVSYIDHLEEYIYTIIVQSVYWSKTVKCSCLAEVLSGLRDNYLATVEVLKNAGDESCDSKELLNGALLASMR